ncbi:MAG: RDD family protein [Xanthomonadales bacterium]|jgi:uncharacterized RDD family membrane protein YckC|nr:RDD family protein [Xanthomonadales bacterium]
MQNDHYQTPKSEVYEIPDDRPVQYAGFWVRFVASLIDSVLMMMIMFPLLIGYYGSSYLDSTAIIRGGFDFLVSWVFPIVAVLLFWIYRAATPGKMALGLRIVDSRSGGKCTVGQLILRYVGYYLSMIPLFLGFIWAGFDRRKQGWHDKIASTVVVKK